MKHGQNVMFFLHQSIRIVLVTIFLFAAGISYSGNSSYDVYLKQINEVPINSPIDIILKDGFAYILCSSSAGGSIITLNISNPLVIPQPVSAIGIEGGTVTSFSFNGPYMYVSSTEGQIKVIDYKNNKLPRDAGTIDANGQIVKMVINNGFLYLIRKDFGLNVYDITVPDFPLYKGTQLVPGEANGLFVKNNLAYISSSNAYLSIIDISDIAKLQIVGSYNFGSNFYDVFVSDNLAYLAQGSTGVQVVNVSQASSPKWMTNLFSRNFSRQVIASGYYTYVNDENTIQVFWNKDPGHQVYAGHFDNGLNNIVRILVQDDKYIYLCSSGNSLKVLQIIYEN